MYLVRAGVKCDNGKFHDPWQYIYIHETAERESVKQLGSK